MTFTREDEQRHDALLAAHTPLRPLTPRRGQELHDLQTRHDDFIDQGLRVLHSGQFLNRSPQPQAGGSLRYAVVLLTLLELYIVFPLATIEVYAPGFFWAVCAVMSAYAAVSGGGVSLETRRSLRQVTPFLTVPLSLYCLKCAVMPATMVTAGHGDMPMHVRYFLCAVGVLLMNAVPYVI